MAGTGGVERLPPASQDESGVFGRLRHRDDVQGLRALAVGLVVMDHAGVRFLQGGYVGVDVFFVLSGFLITGLLLSGARRLGQGRLAKIGDFYARRARRILPAAALTLLTTDLAAYYLLNFVRAKQVLVDSISSSLFVANFHFAAESTNYFAQSQPPSPLQHFWSLAVEEQFYLVWPSLLVLVLFGVSLARKHRSYLVRPRLSIPGRGRVHALLGVIMIAGVASLAWSIYDTHHLATAAYFSTFARVWELALGAGLAIIAPRLAHLAPRARAFIGWSGLACILLAAFTFSASTPFPGYAALLPCVGAALVIAAGIGEKSGRWDVSRPLSARPMRYIGDRSYTIYLWHWPMLILVADYAGHSLSVGLNLVIVLAAVLLSILTYRFYEDPLRRAEWSSRIKPLLLWPVSLAIVLLAAGLSINSIDNREVALQVASASVRLADLSASTQAQNAQVARLEQKASVGGNSPALPTVVRAVEAANRGAPLPSPLTPPVGDLLSSEYEIPGDCAPGDTQTTSHVCRMGDTASRRTLVVFGDSHAQMWMPAILGMATEDGWAVVPLVHSGCWSVRLFDVSYCNAWYRWARGQIKALHPSIILMGNAYGGNAGGTARLILSDIDQIARTLRRYSKHVVLIADDDGLRQQPVDCLLAARATMRTCTETVDPATRFALNDQIAQVSNETHDFALIKTRGWFCYRDECPVVVGNTIVYLDAGHITSSYAQEMTQPLRSAFQIAIK